MKKVFRVFCFVVLSILIVPAFSSQFTAHAGKTVFGDFNSSDCPCGVESPIPCYNEYTWQRCDGAPGQGGGQPQAAAPEKTDDKIGSLGMLLFAMLLILKRFM